MLFFMVHHAEFEQWLPRPLEEVFLFFANPQNMPRIMPAWMKVNLTALQLNPPAGGSAPIAGPGSELLATFRPIPFRAGITGTNFARKPETKSWEL